MSRTMLAIGLLSSLALHGAMLLGPRLPAAPAAAASARAAEVVLVPPSHEEAIEPFAEEAPAPEAEPDRVAAEPPPAPEPPPASEPPAREATPPAGPTVPTPPAVTPPSTRVEANPSAAPPLEAPPPSPAAIPASGGDFAARPDGVAVPRIRIDWGPREQALELVRYAALPIVFVAADGVVREQAERGSDGHWRRQPFRAGAGLSARVRVVDGSPAFAEIASLATPRERIAVMPTVAIDRRIDESIRQAAYRLRIDPAEIAVVRGRLLLRQRSVEFEVLEVERRSP